MSDHDTGGTPSHEQIHIGSKSGWRRLPVIFAVVGVGALGAGFATMGAHPADFWFAYLVALMFWLAPGLGSLFFILVQHATRAGWSVVMRRIAENTVPESLATIDSRGPVRATLELAAGTARRLDVRVGDRVEQRIFAAKP